MKLLYLFSIIVAIEAMVINEEEENNVCEGVMYNGVYHDKEVLKSDIDRPYLLATDRGMDLLYFSYSVNSTEDESKSVKLDLVNKEMEELNVENGHAQTVDPHSHTAYIGSSDGIYKYNPVTKTTELMSDKGINVFHIYFKGGVLYYIDFPNEVVHTLSDDRISAKFVDLEETNLEHMAIDAQGDIVFSNATGVFTQKMGTNTAVAYPNSDHVRGINTDINGKAFICRSEGIYVLNKETIVLERVVEVDAFGVAFDKNNNMIYSDPDSVVRLKPNKDKSC